MSTKFIKDTVERAVTDDAVLVTITTEQLNSGSNEL